MLEPTEKQQNVEISGFAALILFKTNVKADSTYVYLRNFTPVATCNPHTSEAKTYLREFTKLTVNYVFLIYLKFLTFLKSILHILHNH